MAKLNHVLFGQAKGKVGGMVLQRYEGMNIAREKPITVKNPQSTKQTENRVKFKLASQTVGVFKEVINTRLAPLSIYARERRGAALEAIKRKITVTDHTAATLPFADCISAINAKSLTEYGAPNVTESQEQIHVTAPLDSVVVGVIAGFDQDGEYLGRKIIESTGTGAPQDFAIPADYSSSKAMFAYTVAQTAEGRAIYDNLRDSNDDLLSEVFRLVSSGDAAVSDIAGISTY